MWTSNSVVLVEDVSSEFLQTTSNLVANGLVPDRDADVTSMVGKVIADNCAVPQSPVDNLHEGGDSLRFRRTRI